MCISSHPYFDNLDNIFNLSIQFKTYKSNNIKDFQVGSNISSCFSNLYIATYYISFFVYLQNLI